MSSCSRCSHPSPPHARFCAQCGARLERHCTHCGAAIAAAQRFCTACGTAVENAAPALAPSPAPSPANYTPPDLARRILADREQLRGEMKQVTVLFCDLVDSTALATSLGAEGMHAFLSDFFAVALAEVHRFEGTVNQFLGDGLMAIFGAPLAHEDHAARAGLAALAIRDAVTRARSASRHPGWTDAKVRMGLNSGQVVVGTIGDDLRMDYTAAGDTTHLAARLQGIAEADEILCSSTTIDAARGALDGEPLAAVTLKGIAMPVTPVRLRAAQIRTARTMRHATPFLGRDTELQMLLSATRRAASGRGGVVELDGEPGAGKSRLIEEYRAHIGGDSLVLLGQCLTYGAQRPHVPVIEIVAALLSALPDGAPGADFPGRHYLEALCGEPAAAARVKDMDPATLRGRTRQAFIDGVRSAAESRPVAVIVEDLHWADPSSLEYLGALAGGLADTRGVLVASFRPGVEPPWPVAARLARVTLGPLSAAAARAMLAHLLVEQPAEAIREQVLARAEGNPFFLEELARVATSTGVDVPGDVFDVLAARIDRLAPIDKQWLRAAAVVGRDFRLDLLEEIAGGARDTLARLQPLVALGFLEPTATPRTYRFVHALTQEVAYRGMLGVERRALHSAIAERLAATAVDADDHCEDIARHHLAGARPGDALPALEAATAKALRQHALDAAHGHLSDAMRLYEAEPMVPERLVRCVTFLLHAFPIFHFLHRHHEYAALIERYAPAVEALHLPALEGPFRAQRGHRFWVQARAQHADVELQRAIALCDEAGDPVNAAHAAFLLCWLYANTGHCAEGVAYGERGLRYLAQVPVPLLLTYTHVGLLLSTLMRGWFDDADRHGRAARDIGLDAGDDGLASFGGGFLAWVLYEKGDFTGAVAEAQRAFDIAPTDYFRGWAAAWLTAARIRAGDPAADIAVLEHATAMARAAGHIFGWTLIAFLCGEAKACMGDYPGAEHALTALDEEARSMPYPFVSAGTLLVRGECALRTGRAQEALEFFKRAEHEYAAIDCAHRAAQARTGVARAMDTLG